MNHSKFILGLLFCTSLIACRKKDLPTSTVESKGSILVKVKNFVGNKTLMLGDSTSYRLDNGDEFSVSTYNYYLSNFVFIDKNGNRFAENESYHLVMANDSTSFNFTIKDVPFSDFNSIEFLIGVDSVRNFSGSQSGALDPIYGMIWSWNSGYIMAKMEGKHTNSISMQNSLLYHIAGFKGEYNVIQKIHLTMPDLVVKNNAKSPTLTLKSDLAKWFDSPNFTNFFNCPTISSEGIKAYNVSLNYRNMMSILSVENP